MDIFAGSMFVRKTREHVSADAALKDKILGLYFSAQWCPTCLDFTPILCDFYNNLINQGAAFEIIFVTCDDYVEDMGDFMDESHGNWVALLHGDPLIKVLRQKYSVRSIPSLVVIKNNGQLITTEGREDVQKKGAICFSEWCNK